MATGVDRGPHGVGSEELKRSWGWFVGLGVILIVLGLIALSMSVAVTLVTVILFGWLLIVGGVLAAAHAFWRRRWGGFFIDLFTGILYVVVGFMLVGNPAEGAATLTLLIALSLLLGGIFRIIVALAVRFHHWVWTLLNGIVTLLLGILIWRQWPLSGLWVIGLFIGIDMIFYGWSLVMLGLTARGLPDRPA